MGSVTDCERLIACTGSRLMHWSGIHGVVFYLFRGYHRTHSDWTWFSAFYLFIYLFSWGHVVKQQWLLSWVPHHARFLLGEWYSFLKWSLPCRSDPMWAIQQLIGSTKTFCLCSGTWKLVTSERRNFGSIECGPLKTAENSAYVLICYNVCTPVPHILSWFVCALNQQHVHKREPLAFSFHRKSIA